MFEELAPTRPSRVQFMGSSAKKQFGDLVSGLENRDSIPIQNFEDSYQPLESGRAINQSMSS